MADRLGDRRQTRSRSRIVDETPGSTNQTVEPDQDPEKSPVIRGRRSSRRTSNQANIRDSSKSDSKSKSKREKRSRTSNSQGEPGPSSESSDTSRTTKSRRVSASADTDTMNDSIDYVALVQQHLDDERLARQLQDAEQSSVTVINRGPSIISVGGANLPSPIHEDGDEDMDESNDEDPMNQAIGNGFVMSDDSSDDSFSVLLNNRRLENEFRDMEARQDREALDLDNEPILIDSDDVEDEEMENQDRYEDSFINDESMANDRSFARAGLLPELDESEIVPQRRSGVLATPHVLTLGNGRLSVHINGNRESLSSLRDASRASLGVRRSDLDILAGHNRIPESTGSDWPGLMDAHLRRRLETLISRSGLNHSFSDVPIGLSEAQINRLPRTKATAIQCSGNNNSCTICMDEYEPDADLLTLPCFHNFHYDCVKPWFRTKNECPVCRADARKVE